jgi:hypothetical protein
MKWVGNVERVGDMRFAYRILVRRLAGHRPLGKIRHRWSNVIRMDIRERG